MNGFGRGWRLTKSFVRFPLVGLSATSDASEAPSAQNFAAVYAAHFDFVWRCLRGLGVAPAALEDAAQDVFVIVHRRLASFEGRSTFRTWLFGIVRKVAFNYRRSHARKGAHEDLPLDIAAGGPGPFENAQKAEAAAFVEEFLSRQSEVKREVFVLGVLEEMSAPEIAEALSMPLNTV